MSRGELQKETDSGNWTSSLEEKVGHFEISYEKSAHLKEVENGGVGPRSHG